jgi:hypothetical protein
VWTWVLNKDVDSKERSGGCWSVVAFQIWSPAHPNKTMVKLFLHRDEGVGRVKLLFWNV